MSPKSAISSRPLTLLAVGLAIMANVVACHRDTHSYSIDPNSVGSTSVTGSSGGGAGAIDVRNNGAERVTKTCGIMHQKPCEHQLSPLEARHAAEVAKGLKK